MHESYFDKKLIILYNPKGFMGIGLTVQRYGTARTYAFIGFIFYVITWAFGLLAALIVGLIFLTPRPVVTSTPPIVTSFPFFIVSLVLIFAFIPAIVLTFFAWTTVKHIDAGRYSQARTYSLILGIVGLFFGLILGGIFFFLAYANLGETPLQPYQPTTSPQKFCVQCGRPVSADTKFCPYCGKEQPQ